MNYRGHVTINWDTQIFGNNAEHLLEELWKVTSTNPRRSVVSVCPLPGNSIPRRLWSALVLASGFSSETTWGNAPKKLVRKLASNLVACPLEFTGKGTFKDEFVTAGGVDLKEIDMKTMESKICPGLFFCGEVINVDGVTGGYNFMNCWATGYVAGESCSEKATTVTARKESSSNCKNKEIKKSDDDARCNNIIPTVESQKMKCSIHVVDSRERALDLLVFRHGNLFSSVEEYMESNPQVLSREDALKTLTSSYDDKGKDLAYLGSAGQAGRDLVQFYALADTVSGIDNDVPDVLTRCHGVVGSVDAHKQPLEDKDGSVLLIELKNLRVQENMRRQGIGKALVEAVQHYAQSQAVKKNKVVVFLQFDSNNHGAIQLYREAGFVLDDHDQNKMNWYTGSSIRGNISS